MYESMQIEFTCQFEVMHVAFSTLIHRYPSNNLNVNQYCRLDQSRSVSMANKHSSGYIDVNFKATVPNSERTNYMTECMRNKRQNPEFKEKEKHSKEPNDNIQSLE